MSYAEELLRKRIEAAPQQVQADIEAKKANPLYQQWTPEYQQAQAAQQVQQATQQIPQQNQSAPQNETPSQKAQRLIAERSGSQSQPPQAPQKNFLQQLADPAADIAATGIRAFQGVGNLIKAGGQTILGDREAATETMRKANEDIYKPVNIPLLGQGDVRKLGTVNEKGIIMPSEETAKSLGTAVEAASYFAPVKGGKALTSTVGNKVFQKTASPLLAKTAGTVAKYTLPSALAGGMASGGAKLAETGNFGEATKAGSVGALTGGIVGTALPKIASAISKKTTPSVAKAAEMNRKAIALTKGELKKELVSKSKAAKYGLTERNMPLELAKEGIVFKTREEAGRKVFDVADNIAQLGSKMDTVDNQLDNLIASRPGKTINFGSIRKQAFKFIDERSDLSALTKTKLKDTIDKEINATVESVGSWQTSGQVAQQLKKTFQKQAKSLYEAKAKGAVISDTDMAPEALARAFRETIENQYKSVGDVNKLNKELGRLAELSKFVQDYEGRIVKGGYIGRKIGGGIGVLASQAIPAPPVIREMAGYKLGEKLSDLIDDPTRKMAAALKVYQAAVKAGKAQPNALQKILDRFPTANMAAVTGILTGSNMGSEQPAPTTSTPTMNETPSQKAQRLIRERQARQ